MPEILKHPKLKTILDYQTWKTYKREHSNEHKDERHLKRLKESQSQIKNRALSKGEN